MRKTPSMDGYSTCRVVIGSEAVLIPEGKRPAPELTHEWKAYVRAPPEIVKNVQFKLHESFANHFVTTEYPFEVSERGWGEFTIQIKLVLFNDERVLTSHFLKLHGDEDVVVSERIDEIAFKGPGSDITVSEEEAEEHRRIDKAILKILEMFKEREDML